MTLTTDRHQASCGLCATAELLIESVADHLCCPGNSAVSKFVVVTCCTIVFVIVTQIRSLTTKVEPVRTVTFTSVFSSAMVARH